MEQKEREICKGRWLYGGVQAKGVIVLAINYDYYHELEKADGFDLAEETPVLNEQGEMYLLKWTDASFTKQESHTAGHLDLEETLALACSIVNQTIQWVPQRGEKN
jgi:hypothetical protein